MDRRKKYYLVVDVETANSAQEALVYDLGFAICDKKGNIYVEKSYVITDIFFDEKEIYNNREMMSTSYYNQKLPNYYKGLHNGTWKATPLLVARKEIALLMKEWNISEVWAYNCNFDKNALNNSVRYTTKSNLRWFFPYGTQFHCIWNVATQTICKQKGYLRFCLENEFYSEKGNMKTSAETVYAYLTRNVGFEEEHTGLADVKIEVKILAKCLSQHKKIDKNINTRCWQTPQKDFKELRMAL